MRNVREYTTMFVLWGVVILLGAVFMPSTPAYANVFHDAYSFEDDFENDTGLDPAETSGFTIDSGGGLLAEADPATAVSQCITLPQPDGGAFLEWTFLDISLAGVGGSANNFEVQDCSGTSLLTVNNLPDGESSLDLSAISVSAIRLQWSVNQLNAKVNSWKIYGRADHVTLLAITPNTLSPDSGDTITFTLDLASNGAITRNPTLRVSLDDINGLHTPAIDDGLAEDAEVDYGSGVNAYRPLEFVSASAGPNGEVPVIPADGATSGEIVWNLDDMTDGFADNVTITLRIPKGYINGKTLAARAILEHGLSSVSGPYDNQMSEDGTSAFAVVNSVATSIQRAYSPFGNLGPGATNIYDSYYIEEPLLSFINHSDIENITVTITGAGTCTPLFRDINIASHNGYQVMSTPAIGNPITGIDPVIIHFDRGILRDTDLRMTMYYDVPASCTFGNTIGTQSEMVVGNPARTLTGSRSHNVVEEICRRGGNYTHRVMSGNNSGSYATWPGWNEYYISTGSFRTGEYFSTWAPYGNESWKTHTVTLDHSYDLVEIPDGITFHGIRSKTELDRLYKDCTGTAPIPTDAAFNHTTDPPHPSWKPVDTAWSGMPFGNTPDEYDLQAVVAPGCRLLSVKDTDSPSWQSPDQGNWVVQALWRICDGSYGCSELPDGTAMSLVGGTIFTYETFTNPLGSAHECYTYGGWSFYKEYKSWPNIYTWSEEDQVPAGQIAHIVINPENDNKASQYVDGRWVVNLYGIREYVDLAGVTGEVLTDGFNVPDPDQNMTGQSCNPATIAFHVPNPAACMSVSSADDDACMAWWEIPAACQPPNGWGYKIVGDRTHDNYVQLYRLRLNAPILRTTPANTVLDFIAAVRTNDLTSQGAENAVDPARWSADNYTATTSVTVLELPGLDAAKNGPVARKPGDQMTYTLEVQNTGNTPNNGWYLVDWLPRNGVNNSEFTPDYGQVFVDQASGEALVEYSTDAACFTNPLSGSWTAMTLQATVRPGYLAETVGDVAATAACLRIRRDPGTAGRFNPGDMVHVAVDVALPNSPAIDGKVIFNRALVGSAVSFGAGSDVAAVETVNVRTVVSSDVVVKIEKSFEIDPLVAGSVIWTLKVYNASGSTATNVTVLDELPLELTYEGLAAPLPAGWTLVQEPGIGDIGGQIEILIPTLTPDDGNPGSGGDEGTVSFVTHVVPGTPVGTEIINCASATPEIGEGDQVCSATSQSPLEALKEQNLPGDLPGTSVFDVAPGDVFSYLITVTNISDQALYLYINDVLDTYLDYQFGTLEINGAGASDALFAGDTFTYTPTTLFNPGDIWAVAFDVSVSGSASDNQIIQNSAMLMAYTDLSDMWGSAFTALSTNIVKVRIENPENVIPEPSTLILIGTGIVGLFVLIRRRWM